MGKFAALPKLISGRVKFVTYPAFAEIAGTKNVTDVTPVTNPTILVTIGRLVTTEGTALFVYLTVSLFVKFTVMFPAAVDCVEGFQNCIEVM